jgi:hypothetical protein
MSIYTIVQTLRLFEQTLPCIGHGIGRCEGSEGPNGPEGWSGQGTPFLIN